MEKITILCSCPSFRRKPEGVSFHGVAYFLTCYNFASSKQSLKLRKMRSMFLSLLRFCKDLEGVHLD